MTFSAIIAILLICLGVLLIVYVYWGYCALLSLIAAVRGECPVQAVSFADYWPSVTVLLTVHDEEQNLPGRVANLLQQEYSGQIDILIVSDGSTDKTDAIATLLAERGVARFLRTERLGKSEAQNAAMEHIRTDLVVLTDAETRFAPNCVRELAAAFADPAVGCASGQLALVPQTGVIAENQNRYWSYEMRLRDLESRLGILTVASGQVMAFRRKLFRPLPPYTGDDCVIPLDVVRQGQRVVHCRSARAIDVIEHEAEREFSSRVRMTMRNWSGIWRYPELLNPLRNPGYALALWSHKLLRWLGSLALVVIALSTTVLGFNGFAWPVAVAYAAVLALGLAGHFARRSCGGSTPVTGPIYAFLLANLGFLVGLWNALSGKRVHAYRSGGTM